MVDESRLGTIRRQPNGLSVRYVRRFRHPPERVWQALTESDHLRHWMPCDIVGERRAGATIELPFWPDHVSKYDIETPTLHGEIRVFQPPAVFEWTWDTDVLRWELAPDGDGTVLTFTTLLGDDVAGARNVRRWLPRLPRKPRRRPGRQPRHSAGRGGHGRSRGKYAEATIRVTEAAACGAHATM